MVFSCGVVDEGCYGGERVRGHDVDCLESLGEGRGGFGGVGVEGCEVED